MPVYILLLQTRQMLRVHSVSSAGWRFSGLFLFQRSRKKLRQEFDSVAKGQREMTRQDLIEFCLAFPAAYEDYPFDDITDPGKWTVMRHCDNKKSFALIYERNSKLCVNLKCDPIEADFLRQIFTDVTPGYHMNKAHWNTIVLGGDVLDDELKRMVESSYILIKSKARNSK